MRNIYRKSLTALDIAKIGVAMENYDADGWHGGTHRTRNPSIGRQAALALIAGQPLLDSERLIREEYEAKVLAAEIWSVRGMLFPSVRKHLFIK